MKYYNREISSHHSLIQYECYLISDSYLIKDCAYLLNEKSDLIYTKSHKYEDLLKELQNNLRDILDNKIDD